MYWTCLSLCLNPDILCLLWVLAATLFPTTRHFVPSVSACGYFVPYNQTFCALHAANILPWRWTFVYLCTFLSINMTVMMAHVYCPSYWRRCARPQAKNSQLIRTRNTRETVWITRDVLPGTVKLKTLKTHCEAIGLWKDESLWWFRYLWIHVFLFICEFRWKLTSNQNQKCSAGSWNNSLYSIWCINWNKEGSNGMYTPPQCSW